MFSFSLIRFSKIGQYHTCNLLLSSCLISHCSSTASYFFLKALAVVSNKCCLSPGGLLRMNPFKNVITPAFSRPASRRQLTDRDPFTMILPPPAATSAPYLTATAGSGLRSFPCGLMAKVEITPTGLPVRVCTVSSLKY